MQRRSKKQNVEGQKGRKKWVLSGDFCRRRKPMDGESEMKAASVLE